jgi:histone H3/H4
MLPLLPFERICKAAGIERVSEEALKEMREIVEERANTVAEEADRLARHAGRKTVTKEDIEFVIRRKR